MRLQLRARDAQLETANRRAADLELDLQDAILRANNSEDISSATVARVETQAREVELGLREKLEVANAKLKVNRKLHV